MRSHDRINNASSSSKKKYSGGAINTSNITNTATSSSFSMISSRRKKFGWKLYVLVLLALIVLGTFTVLRTVVHFFGTHEADFISLDEMLKYKSIEALPFNPNFTPEEAREEEIQLGLRREKIPRIIHQTWKNQTLPERWEIVRRDCMAMMPDFEFKMWSDQDSRDFIAAEYPSFLQTWDSYPFNIQRADAIRYFVLHKYGGIYMDLDIGCRAHPGPLLHFETILPVTKPVGVSNDLMFSAPKTPFMDLVINSLETFNHEWLYMPYPTVMFSTGPMFISAIYSMWSRILEKGIGIEPPSQTSLYKRVRILPKPLYGKNAAPEEVPDSFFWHYYGSSWHAGDAGFVGFLGKYGYRILLLGSSFVFIGFCYLVWSKRHYVLPSPRQRKLSLDPFEDLTIAPPITHADDKHDYALTPPQKSYFRSRMSHFANFFKASNTGGSVTETKYTRVPTVPPPYIIRQRSNTAGSDSVSLHSIHTHTVLPPTTTSQPVAPTARRKPRVHPIATKPHGRQRSRDIERGSPISPLRGPSGSYFNAHPTEKTASGQSSAWPLAGPSMIHEEPAAFSSSPPRLFKHARFPSIQSESSTGESTQYPISQSPPAMLVTAPSASNTPERTWSPEMKNKRRSNRGRKVDSRNSSGSSSSASSASNSRSSSRHPTRPTLSRNVSSNDAVGNNRFQRPHRSGTSASAQDTNSLHARKSSGGTTDGEVSASELRDYLTELAPLTSSGVAVRSGIISPGEREQTAQVMRKRSLSSEGERFRGE